MEHLVHGKHVWLRNLVTAAYLHADEDGRLVSLHPHRASLSAAWRVQRSRYYIGDTLLHLQGAAYGRYLAATKEAARPGHRGFRAEQHDFDDCIAWSTTWRACSSGFGNSVLFCHISGAILLRGNGYRWDTGVTVDAGDEMSPVSPMMYWVVERIPRRDTIPPLPGPPQIPGNVEEDGRREVRYLRVDGHGRIADGRTWAFPFAGRSVFNLKKELAQRLGKEGVQGEFTMCVRAGRYAGLTPLVVDLPISGDPLHVIIFMAGSPAIGEMRHPDVGAAAEREG